VRRYTPDVEEYSIDECFADLTGLCRPLRMSYERMARAIKHDVDTELGFTFSVGLAPNKVLAKIKPRHDLRYTRVHLRRPYPVRINSNNTNCCVEKD
jgi:nucleotidyltransferase/DNA polymerase involved in DNA repair